MYNPPPFPLQLRRRLFSQHTHVGNADTHATIQGLFIFQAAVLGFLSRKTAVHRTGFKQEYGEIDLLGMESKSEVPSHHGQGVREVEA